MIEPVWELVALVVNALSLVLLLSFGCFASCPEDVVKLWVILLGVVFCEFLVVVYLVVNKAFKCFATYLWVFCFIPWRCFLLCLDHNEAQRVLASEDHNLKLQPESDPLRLHEKCLFYILHCMFQKQSLSFVFSLFHV